MHDIGYLSVEQNAEKRPKPVLNYAAQVLFLPLSYSTPAYVFPTSHSHTAVTVKETTT